MRTIHVHPIDRLHGGKWVAHIDGDIAVAIGAKGGPTTATPALRLYGVDELDMLAAVLKEIRPAVKAAEEKMRSVPHDRD